MAFVLRNETVQSSAFAPSRAQAIIGVAIAFSITSFISLVLRFAGKRINKTKLSSEDWVIILAQVVVFSLGATIILEVVLGNAGHHAWASTSKIPKALQILVAVQCLYATSLCLIKVSICLFYNRIFAFRNFQITSWVAIALVICWAIGAILYAFLSCRPFHYTWDPTMIGGSCVKNKVIPYVIIGALDVVIDIFILVLPLPLLCRLRISMTDKVALIGIFGVGVCTMVISILRVHAHVNILFDDITYTGAPALLYSFLEPAIGISVACAPLTRPVFHRNALKVDIELSDQSNSNDRRLGSWLEDMPSYVDRNLWSGRRNGFGRQQVFVTTQVLESGNWSEASESRTRLPSAT
ncbi:hypothetical protein B0J11DRAFT_233625 [Dendryphion nanum]|uniref:Rhodopsin domain-containing protein n=1 Tax=Dendryphion nanum TaxID=256645 RepID=A0A9P9CZR8_9PLEO|nr:hypothetical protein B0J11DRAFT_233625 [Dendryphion nanum]